jgi:ATP-dependent RNA helicase RhlE
MNEVSASGPDSATLFSDLKLSQHMNSIVSGLGFKSPTPIQSRAIPIGLAGGDIIGLAQTGTGKTAAFGIPMIERLRTGSSKAIRALVLAPTRELADQIHDTIKQLTKGTPLTSCVIFGGVSHGRQLDELRRKPSIVVACPGRLLDHVRGRSIDLSAVEIFIVDEADRMCDMGFLPDVRKIARLTPQERQTMLFSATMPEEVESVTRELLINPQTIRVSIERPVSTITHGAYRVDEKGKADFLSTWLSESGESRVVVFAQMKHVAKRVAEKLAKSGVRAASLHGNLSQGKRKDAIEGFRKGRYSVLVATDIAARGIDVDGISHVVNYDMPHTLDSYIHRAGRAGRASRSGEAISFVTHRDRGVVRAIERYLGMPLQMLGEFRTPAVATDSRPKARSTDSESGALETAEAGVGMPQKKQRVGYRDTEARPRPRRSFGRSGSGRAPRAGGEDNRARGRGRASDGQRQQPVERGSDEWRQSVRRPARESFREGEKTERRARSFNGGPRERDGQRSTPQARGSRFREESREFRSFRGQNHEDTPRDRSEKKNNRNFSPDAQRPKEERGRFGSAQGRRSGGKPFGRTSSSRNLGPGRRTSRNVSQQRERRSE